MTINHCEGFLPGTRVRLNASWFDWQFPPDVFPDRGDITTAHRAWADGHWATVTNYETLEGSVEIELDRDSDFDYYMSNGACLGEYDPDKLAYFGVLPEHLIIVPFTPPLPNPNGMSDLDMIFYTAIENGWDIKE